MRKLHDILTFYRLGAQPTCRAVLNRAMVM